MPARKQLTTLIRRLTKTYGAAKAPPIRDPFRLLLWEQVAYLADDETRLSAWRALKSRIGTSPREIAGASTADLVAVARIGGAIAAPQRAGRMRAVAERVLGHWDGDLKPVLRLPLADARRELSRYPSIGTAGAERILLTCGSHAVLGLDSNALRVLLRLGYGVEVPNWSKAYASAQAAASAQLPKRASVLRAAFLQLRKHGQTVCRRTRPECQNCPLRADCPTGRRATKTGFSGPTPDSVTA